MDEIVSTEVIIAMNGDVLKSPFTLGVNNS
jgi:hypothetical protein